MLLRRGMPFGTNISSLLMLITMALAYQKIRSRPNEIQEKIAGGNEGNIEDYPYLVRLIIRGKNRSLACSGSYIRPRWVLTASHCLDINDDENAKPPDIGLDKTRAKCLGGLKSSQGTRLQAIPSIDLIMSPNYSRNQTDVINDIGLIRLMYSFKMTSSVKLIGMPKSKVDYSGKSVLIMGWGNMEVEEKPRGGNATEAGKLQILKTTVGKCQGQFNSPSAICLEKKGEVTCSGDSGAPMVLDNLIIGVSSGGFGCSEDYAVYEDVYSHNEWINEVAGKPNCKLCKSVGLVIPRSSYLFSICFLVYTVLFVDY